MGGGHVLTNLPKQVSIYHTPERLPLNYSSPISYSSSQSLVHGFLCSKVPGRFASNLYTKPVVLHNFISELRKQTGVSVNSRPALFTRVSCLQEDFHNCQGYREKPCVKKKKAIYSIASASAPDLKVPAITALQEKMSKWTLPN